jgi:hypothetical protein
MQIPINIWRIWNSQLYLIIMSAHANDLNKTKDVAHDLCVHPNLIIMTPIFFVSCRDFSFFLFQRIHHHVTSVSSICSHYIFIYRWCEQVSQGSWSDPSWDWTNGGHSLAAGNVYASCEETNSYHYTIFAIAAMIKERANLQTIPSQGQMKSHICGDNRKDRIQMFDCDLYFLRMYAIFLLKYFTWADCYLMFCS